jgi:hypothetical protein
MEEKGYILLKFDGVINGKKLSPLDVDISEIKEIITDIEVFLYPTRSDKSERPHIAYSIEDGSALHKFFLPLTSVLFFNGLIGEVENRKAIDFLDFKRAEIIEKFQRIAKQKDLEITFSTSSTDTKILKITKETNYFNVVPKFINTEFTLYGEVYQEGGMTPNFHINTKEFGKLTVSATREQILEGEKRIYKIYGLKAAGKQSLENMKPYDLKLEHFIDYNPVFDKAELDLLIARATPNLSKIENVDNWLIQIREGGLFE